MQSIGLKGSCFFLFFFVQHPQLGRNRRKNRTRDRRETTVNLLLGYDVETKNRILYSNVFLYRF